MDIARLKIRRERLPDFDLGVESFHCTPGCLPDAMAMRFRRDEEDFQFPMVSVHLEDESANLFAFEADTVCLSTVDASLDGLSGDDFAGFLEMVVPAPELLQSTVVESILIVANELLPVFRFQWQKLDFHENILQKSY